MKARVVTISEYEFSESHILTILIDYLMNKEGLLTGHDDTRQITLEGNSVKVKITRRDYKK